MVGISSNVWIPALIAFLAVALGTMSLVLVWEWYRDRARKRSLVSRVRELSDQLDRESTGQPSVFRAAMEQAAWLQPLAARLPQLKDLELLLQQADLRWSLQTYLLLSVGLAAALGVAGLVVTNTLPVALGACAFGGFLPYAFVAHRRSRRLAAFEELLPDAVDLVGRALRAGHPLAAGFKMAADDGPEPVATELRRVFEEQRFGMPLQDSLLGMADRVDLMDVRILVTAILIQREVGGNLAEILDNLANVIRVRFTVRRQLRVYTAQGRMTGYLLGALPILLFSILYMMNPEYMSILFKDPVGRIVTGVAISLQLLGFIWIRKIINIEI